MRAVVKTRPGRGAELRRDVAERDLRAGEVRLQVKAASVCGTDVAVFEDSSSAAELDRTLPLTMGHECSAVVVEVCGDTGELAVGDRVAVETHIACHDCFQCRTGRAHNCLRMSLLGIQVDGCFAERVVVPASTCFPLPESMSFETAALLEPAGSAMHAVQRSGADLAGSNVMISGAGPIGLVLVQVARASGAHHVLVVEPNEHRRALARQQGAAALAPDDDVVGVAHSLSAHRQGFDVAFECSGAAPALASLLDGVRREATVVSVGLPHRPVEMDVTRYLVKKGLTLRGSFGRQLWQSWETLVALVGAGLVDLDGLVSHRLPLDRFEEAFALVGGDSCKVVLDPTMPEDGPAEAAQVRRGDPLTLA